MGKNNILQFEADDTSKTGVNGKQVFFAKRINGKVTRNKEIEQESNHIFESKKSNEEELFIELKNVKIKPEEIPPKSKTPKNNNINKKRKYKKEKISRRSIISRISIIIVLIIGMIIFALISPLFNIEEINVTGNNRVNSETIISLSGTLKGKNIFQISESKIAKLIKENTYIDSVKIKRRLPKTLEINVQERKIAYQIKVINSYIYIDFQGYILETSSKSGKVPVIEGFKTDQDTLLNGKRLSNEDIEGLRTILRIMETAKNVEIDKSISKITIENKGDYILELNKENKIVYLGDATDLTNRMTYVKLIVDNEKKHTGKIFVNGDINNGFKPYFREEKNEGNDKK